MPNHLTNYQKQKDFLVCVDSDGCAMDTMDVKHIRCFGPCMVTEWKLEKWQDEILARWNEINLYTMTRGINRFKGLSMALQEINEKYCPIEDLDTLTEWAANSPELSNDAVKRAMSQAPESVILPKALNWSLAVNESINRLPESEKLPFAGVKEALAYAQQYADVAIVSSANLGAVLDEWKLYGLLEHTDIVLAQDAGSKAFCIGELLKKAVSWTLGGLLTLFTAYLTVSGTLAGSADAQAVKMAQSALSAAVPVVGSILSDAAESVLAGAGLMRGMVGTLGTLAVAGLCLLPLLRLGCQYALYQAASLVAAAVGPKKLVKLLSMLGDAFGLVLAMTAASALLLLVSLMTSVLALTP